MAWNIAERFPSWGETGEFPAAGFFYEGGDQVNEKHLDALWNGVNGLEEDIQAALNDIDSNADGVVDKAEAGAAGFDLDGDLLADDGEVIWDESEGFIPQPRLQNDSITVNANTGITGGGTTALGSSFGLELNESTIKDGGPKEIDVQEFAGGDGTNGQIIYTDGANAFWGDPPALQTSEDGVQILSLTEGIDFINGISVSDDGDGTVTVDADENSLAYDFVMN